MKYLLELVDDRTDKKFQFILCDLEFSGYREYVLGIEEKVAVRYNVVEGAIVHQKKLFGVALDPSDDPWSLGLKQAWMMRAGEGLEAGPSFLDPYDAVIDTFESLLCNCGIEPAGKFPVPSWLWPKSEREDFPLVNVENIGSFYDRGGLTEIIRQLQGFVENKILPARPIMLGIDHSATMGVISTLAKKYNPEKLSVIVLDQHFDALPVSIRVAEAAAVTSSTRVGWPSSLPSLYLAGKDHLSCGNFWAYLIDEGNVRPENLSFIGVMDYPTHARTGNSIFQKSYLSFEARGCSFFPAEQFQGQYLDSLTRFISKGIRTPYVYVSMDLDVGSFTSILAARHMDRPGLNAENILDVAHQIRKVCQSKTAELVGFDVMEFNMHFLGLETDEGIKDTTLSLVGDFIKTLSAP